MLAGYYILPAAVMMILVLPGRYAAAVFLGTVIFVPTGVEFSVGGFHLYPIRVVILAGLAHLALKRQLRPVERSLPDKLMLILGGLCVWSAFFHEGVLQSFVFRVGKCVDFLGSYYLFRCWLRDWDDLSALFKAWFVFTAALAACLTVEAVTGQNILNKVGGLPLLSDIREGRLRARGPFRHPVLAGTAGAVFVPFSIALCRWKPRIGFLGLIAGIAIVIFSGSSGPVGSLVAAFTGVTLWLFRRRLSIVLRGGLFLLVFLHLVMKAPVWYLLARFDVVGGSSGWHRGRVIDKAILHINEWWFAGTDYTRNWMPTGVGWSEHHTDITNNFIGMGIMGGLPLMLAFIAVIWVCFGLLGKKIRLLSTENRRLEFLFWCMGSSLFSHVISMLGVAYYDQSSGLFFAMLGAIVSSSVPHKRVIGEGTFLPIASQLGSCG